MNYSELTTLIDAYVNRNGVQAITGQILNGVLNEMVDQLGRGYQIMGVAKPTDDPGLPDGPECWFAGNPGTYTNFGGITVVDGEIALLCYDTGWTKRTFFDGFANVEATVDSSVGTPSASVSYADGTLTFTFSNLKGDQGTAAEVGDVTATVDDTSGTPEVTVTTSGPDTAKNIDFGFKHLKGETGDAAGFGTISATVDANVGTPSVTVLATGPDTAKEFSFDFKNLKGEQGAPGPQGPDGPAGVQSAIVVVDNNSGVPYATASVENGVLSIAFHNLKGENGEKGDQGDTGVSADYPIAIVNNLTTPDPASALSANMGVQLEGEINGVSQELGDFSDYDYTTQEWLEVTHLAGFIKMSDLTTGGNENYYHAKLSVVPGQEYEIAGYNVDASDVFCAFVVKEGTSTKAIAFGQATAGRMAGTYTIPAGYDTLYINGRVNTADIMVIKTTDKEGTAKSAVDSLNEELFGEIKETQFINATIDDGIFSDTTIRVVNPIPINTGGDVRVICGGDVRILRIHRYSPAKDPVLSGASGTDYTVTNISSTDYVVEYDADFPNTYITFCRASDSSIDLTATEVAANVHITDLEAKMLVYESEIADLETIKESALVDADLDRDGSSLSFTKETISSSETVYIPLPEFYSKNLLNRADSDVMLGYRQYTDTPQENANYNLSGYIPVEAGKTYVYSTKNTSFTTMSYIAVFDRNRTFLRSDSGINTYTAQSGDVFVRLTLRTNAWDESAQFEEGNEPTTYEEYGVQFKYPRIVPPDIVMPKRVYTTKGVENSIYHKNYCDFLTDDFAISSYRSFPTAAWQYLDRCFRTDNGTQTIEIVLHTKSPVKKLKQVSVASSVGDPATDNGTVNVLCIGDSFTYDGRYLQQIDDICPNINLVGMRKPAQAIQDDSIRCEGRGGWTLASYFQPYDDLTPSHMQPFSPFMHPSGYKYYGPTPFWSAIVNGTSQYGYGTNGFTDYSSWFDSNGYKLNPDQNDMMYDGVSYKYWNGNAWATYVGEPDFVFDFATYVSVWNIPSPDIVFVFLGKNDFNTGVNGWADYKQKMDTLIASVHSYDSDVKVGVCTPTTADEAANNSDNRNAFLSHMNMWNARKLLIENYDSLTDSKVYIVDTGTVLDPDYGFVLEERLPFAFYEGNERELFATNGVHPSGAGYKQLGTCMAGFVQAKR